MYLGTERLSIADCQGRQQEVALRALFQCFEQEENLGGHPVVQSGEVGQGGVAAAGDDGLQRFNQGANPGGRLRVAGQLLELGRSGRRVAGQQGPAYVQADAAVEVVILAAVAPVSQVGGDGFALGLLGGGSVSSGGLDVRKDGPRAPRLGPMAELRFTFDSLEDFQTASSKRRILRRVLARLFLTAPSLAASRISTYLSAA